MAERLVALVRALEVTVVLDGSGEPGALSSLQGLSRTDWNAYQRLALEATRNGILSHKDAGWVSDALDGWAQQPLLVRALIREIVRELDTIRSQATHWETAAAWEEAEERVRRGEST